MADEINEYSIIHQFKHLTKRNKLPMKVKKIISDHPDITWCLTDRESRSISNVRRSRGENEDLSDDGENLN